MVITITQGIWQPSIREGTELIIFCDNLINLAGKLISWIGSVCIVAFLETSSYGDFTIYFKE